MTLSDAPGVGIVGESVAALEDELVAFRRDLHAHPELSHAETRTTSRVAARLTAAGVRVRPLTGTGLIGDIGPLEPAYGLALREQADRLAAQGLGVRLIFQPAEEVTPGGSLAVIEQGGIAGVDAIFSIHCDPTLDVGLVGLREGPITAATDSVTITLRGRGGHTSRPHLTQDLIYALGKVVTDVPAALSRRVDPRAGVVLVWGAIHSGAAENVIPSTGTVNGTLRMLDAKLWQDIGPLLEELVHAVIRPYAVSATIEHRRGAPPVVNDPVLVGRLRAAADLMLGPQAPTPTVQSLGGEDFAWYLQAVPGAMARLGTRTPGGATYDLHQGDLVVDERAVAIGAWLLQGVAMAPRPG